MALWQGAGGDNPGRLTLSCPTASRTRAQIEAPGRNACRRALLRVSESPPSHMPHPRRVEHSLRPVRQCAEAGLTARPRRALGQFVFQRSPGPSERGRACQDESRRPHGWSTPTAAWAGALPPLATKAGEIGEAEGTICPKGGRAENAAGETERGSGSLHHGVLLSVRYDEMSVGTGQLDRNLPNPWLHNFGIIELVNCV